MRRVFRSLVRSGALVVSMGRCYVRRETKSRNVSSKRLMVCEVARGA
jgi:hypothetical protein